MTKTRPFHLSDVLSITTGALVSTRHMDGIYDVLNWMTGDNLFTHQLPRASQECSGPLLEQHPDLAEIVLPKDLGPDNWRAWLAEMVARYGEFRDVAPLAAVDHTVIDPVTELVSMVGPDKVMVVELPARAD